MENKIFVDFECVDKFIKEISIFFYDSKNIFHFFMKIPNYYENTSRESRRFVKNWHHIPADYGDTSIKTIIRYLNQPNSTLYIKGLQKLRILEKFTFNEIINLEDLGCPRFDLLEESEPHFCSFHETHPTTHCSFRKLLKLIHWYDSQFIKH
jgi:hypothetical protein